MKRLTVTKRIALTLSPLFAMFLIIWLHIENVRLENQIEVMGKSLIEALNKNRIINKLPEGGIYKSNEGKVSYHHVSEKGLETIYYLN